MRKTSLILVALLAGCATLRGSGTLATEVRTVPSFTAVEARDGVQVDFLVDPQLQGDVTLEVSTDDNLLDRILTDSSGGTLVIDVEGSLSTKLGLMVTGDVPSLDAVSASDGAVLTVSNLGADTLTASAADGAVVNVSGAATQLKVDARNGAVLNADALTAETAVVDVQDGATASICVTGSVTGSVQDGGVLDVSCGGNASAVQTSDGGVVRD
jgi:hypothetical protein